MHCKENRCVGGGVKALYLFLWGGFVNALYRQIFFDVLYEALVLYAKGI